MLCCSVVPRNINDINASSLIQLNTKTHRVNRCIISFFVKMWHLFIRFVLVKLTVSLQDFPHCNSTPRIHATTDTMVEKCVESFEFLFSLISSKRTPLQDPTPCSQWLQATVPFHKLYNASSLTSAR